MRAIGQGSRRSEPSPGSQGSDRCLEAEELVHRSYGIRRSDAGKPSILMKTLPPQNKNPTYQYLKDPVFLMSVMLYMANRIILKPLTANDTGTVHEFIHWHLNDFLCIPFCLPPLLFIERTMGLRYHDGPPTRTEIVGSLIIWIGFFEWAAPLLFRRGTVADPSDIPAYIGGAILCGLIWGAFRPMAGAASSS